MRKFLLLAMAVLLVAPVAWGQNQGTISGTVLSETDNGNLPLPSAIVVAFPAGSGHPAGSAITNEEGNYAIEVPYGNYHIRAGAMHFVPEWYDDVRHRNQATIVPVTEDHNAEDINFILAGFQHDGGVISGRIIEQGTDHGIPMAHVTAIRIGDDPFERTVLSSWRGYYGIPQLPPGEYAVSATKTGWSEGVYPETLTVDGNVFEHIDVYLERLDGETGSISGVISDAASDEPIAGALVVARGSNRWNTHFIWSGEDGSYTIEGLPPDTYHVVAHKEGYFPNEYPEDVVVNGDDIAGIDIALSPMVETGISGTVTDASNGEPIAGARIIAVNVDHHRIHGRAETGDDGSYELEVRPGEYAVQAFAHGYFSEEYTEHVFVGEDGFTENIDFALTAFEFGSISGTVTDTEGNPIPMAVVAARMLDGFFRRHTRTDENGAYTFDEVIPGEYSVRAFKWGYYPGMYPETVLVENGQDVTGIDIVLEPFTPPFDGLISGAVTDDVTGEPIANAIVVAFGLDNSPPWRHRWVVRRTFTSEDGTYAFEHLPEIPFKLFSCAPEYVGEFYDDVHTFHEATPVIPDAENIDFALTPRSAGMRNIGGRITLHGGEPGVESIIYAAVDGEIIDVGIADLDGYYSFNDLEIGAYEISAFSIYGEGELGYPADVTFDDLSGADIILSPTDVDQGTELLPTRNSLSQNYPNPFNAQTVISFALVQPADVTLEVFNIIGQKVTVLANGFYQAGRHDVIWDGRDSGGKPVASGIYYYRLEAGDYSETNRMTLLK